MEINILFVLHVFVVFANIVEYFRKFILTQTV